MFLTLLEKQVLRVSEWTVLQQDAFILFYICEGIKQGLHFEKVEPDFKLSESPRFQTFEKVVDPGPCYSPVETSLVCDNPLLLVDNEVKDPVISSQAVPTEPFESSNQVPMEVEVEAPIVYSQVKSPNVSKQIQRDTNISVLNTLQNSL